MFLETKSLCNSLGSSEPMDLNLNQYKNLNHLGSGSFVYYIYGPWTQMDLKGGKNGQEKHNNNQQQSKGIV